ncbi:antibiotic biosynthesis monooxygenase [Ruegeria lacuscaerulensis]|uniref:antibiotic biosynthesis monooxygenase n=1 Tax=Ruegeria lacuscaerulensis TaxID=55218 RepID=UPI00147E4BD1|nr:antibiotic biosynthesis monooxygenase [Ruegeria lacuscaerulensis]
MSAAVVRRWEAVVAREDVPGWVETFRTRALPGMRTLNGFLSVSFLVRREQDPCHIVVLTKWRDMAAIVAYAGQNAEKTVMPDFMAKFFKSYDAEATFYDEVLQEGRDE